MSDTRNLLNQRKRRTKRISTETGQTSTSTATARAKDDKVWECPSEMGTTENTSESSKLSDADISMTSAFSPRCEKSTNHVVGSSDDFSSRSTCVEDQSAARRDVMSDTSNSLNQRKGKTKRTPTETGQTSTSTATARAKDDKVWECPSEMGTTENTNESSKLSDADISVTSAFSERFEKSTSDAVGSSDNVSSRSTRVEDSLPTSADMITDTSNTLNQQTGTLQKQSSQTSQKRQSKPTSRKSGLLSARHASMDVMKNSEKSSESADAQISMTSMKSATLDVSTLDEMKLNESSEQPCESTIMNSDPAITLASGSSVGKPDILIISTSVDTPSFLKDDVESSKPNPADVNPVVELAIDPVESCLAPSETGIVSLHHQAKSTVSNPVSDLMIEDSPVPSPSHSRVRTASEGRYRAKREVTFTVYVEDLSNQPIKLFVHRNAQVHEIATACGHKTWSVWQQMDDKWVELRQDAHIRTLKLSSLPVLHVKPMEFELVRVFVCVYQKGEFHQAIFSPSFLLSSSSSIQTVVDEFSKKHNLTKSQLADYRVFMIPLTDGARVVQCDRWKCISGMTTNNQLWIVLGLRQPSESFKWLTVETTRGEETSNWKYPVTNKMTIEQLTPIVFPLQELQNVTFSRETGGEFEVFRQIATIGSLGLTAEDKIVAVPSSEVNDIDPEDIRLDDEIFASKADKRTHQPPRPRRVFEFEQNDPCYDEHELFLRYLIMGMMEDFFFQLFQD
jgi:hypothetical protein